MPIDPNLLESTLKMIEKRYVGTVNVDVDRKPPRISTNSLSLDYAMGGGIPIGRVSRFWGTPSSGKTLTCWNVIANAQKMGLSCVYYNLEKQFTPEFVEQRGVDLDKLTVIEGNKIEETGVKLEALLGAAHVHVVDSLDAGIAIDELETPLEKNPAMALKARAWLRVVARMKERQCEDNTILLISQSRQSFAYGNAPELTFKSVEFASCMTVQFRQGKWLFYDEDGYLSEDGTNTDTLSGMMEPQGFVVNTKVTKTRVSTSYKTATMMMDLATKEFDRTAEIEKAARYFGIVKTTSPGRFEMPDGTKIHGRKNLRKVLDDPALVKLVTDKMMESA